MRFELPFNIWCGHCNGHIGMGVRYNAEKRKIGSYYTTPIFAFRCKCHLCSGWFEIQTDPKNTRYVVTEGARQQAQDWDPEENGGHAVVEDDPTKKPVLDALATLEKTVEKDVLVKTVMAPRLEQLQDQADKMRADPYAHSQRVRKQFRAEKKTEAERRRQDDAFRDKYGLSEDLALERETDATRESAREELQRERDLRKAIPPPLASIRTKASSGAKSSVAAGLKATLLRNTFSKSARSKPSLASASSSSKPLITRK